MLTQALFISLISSHCNRLKQGAVQMKNLLFQNAVIIKQLINQGQEQLQLQPLDF